MIRPPGTSYQALLALAACPGEIVSVDALTRATQTESSAQPKYVSKYLTYLRDAFEEPFNGDDALPVEILRDALRCNLDATSREELGEDGELFDDLDLRALLKLLIHSKRNVGYRLALRAEAVRVHGHRTDTFVRVDGRAVREARERRGDSIAQLGQGALSPDAIRVAEEGGPIRREEAIALATRLDLPFAAIVLLSPDEIRRRISEAGFAPRRPTERWVDRPDTERQLADQLLSSDARRALLIHGLSGSGKTALAARFIRDHEGAFPQGIVWVDASTLADELDVRHVQKEIADALGFGGHLRFPERSLGPLHRTNGASWREAFLRHLWARPRLVVLDDLRSLVPLRAFEPLGSAGRLVATTALPDLAREFNGARLPLAGLERESGVELITTLLSDDFIVADEGELHELVDVVGGSPRELSVVASHVRSGQIRTLGDAVESITSGNYAAVARTPTPRPRDAAHATPIALSTIAKVGDDFGELVAPLTIFESAPFTLALASRVCSIASNEMREILQQLVEIGAAEMIAPDVAGFYDDPEAAPTLYRLLSDVAWVRRPHDLAESQRETRRRLWAGLEEESRLLASLPAGRRRVRYRALATTWRFGLNELLGEISGFDRHKFPALSPQIRSESLRFTTPRELLNIVAPMSDTLARVPEYAAEPWLLAACAIAASVGDSLAKASIARSIAAWWIHVAGNFGEAREWLRVGLRNIRGRDRHGGAELRALLARAEYSAGHREEALRLVREAAEVARLDGGDPRVHARIATFAAAGRVHDGSDSSEIVEAFEDAARYADDAARETDGAAPWCRAICRFNLAAVQVATERAGSADLDEAWRELDATLHPAEPARIGALSVLLAHHRAERSGEEGAVEERIRQEAERALRCQRPRLARAALAVTALAYNYRVWLDSERDPDAVSLWHGYTAMSIDPDPAGYAVPMIVLVQPRALGSVFDETFCANARAFISFVFGSGHGGVRELERVMERVRA